MRTVEIRNVAVIGAGMMGHGIAQALASAGYDVRLQARTGGGIRRALAAVEANLEMFVENDLAKPDDARQALGRIRGVTEIAEAVAGADYVVEAVVEDLSLKQELFGQFERLSPQHTIFTSTTSGLSVNRIAEGTGCPERVIVTHFWNPPHIMSVVEVVPGERTAPEALAATCELLRRCGKRPVVLNKDVPGFIGNRLQFALFREAMSLVEQGIASAEDVDAVVELTFGRRLPVTGPLKTADLAGLDLLQSIARYLLPDIARGTYLPRVLREAVERGHIGAKAGRGFHEWTPEKAREITARRDRELLRWLKTTGQ